jgi:hypothetical protein
MEPVKNHIVKIPEGQPSGGSYIIWPEGQLQTSPPLSREAVRRQIVLAAVQTAFDSAERVLQAADAVAVGLTEGLDYAGLVAALEEMKLKSLAVGRKDFEAAVEGPSVPLPTGVA